MKMTTIYYCFLYPLTILAVYTLTKQLFNKIQNLPPTPFPCLPIIGHLYLLKKPLHKTLWNLSNRNGPVFLLQFGSRRVLVVSSPSAVEECLTKNDIVFANRPRISLGKYLGNNFTSLSWAPYGDHWRNLRRVSSLQLLSTSRLQTLSSVRADEIRSMVRRLFRGRSASVDLRTTVFDLAMNIMMRMIAGKSYYGENVSDLEEANRYKEIHAQTFKLVSAVNMGDFIPWIKSVDLEKNLIDCSRKRGEFMQDLIDQHRTKMGNAGDDEKPTTLIEVLLESQKTDPDYYTDDLIRTFMLLLIIAGTDTSINTIEWSLSLLLNHPEELKKAQNEIDQQVGFERLISESDIAKLPHLRAIIDETLRMYPPAPLLSPHESSEECMVQGYRVPRGTMLLINCWGIQNDPKNWVEPRKFRPDRFVGKEGGKDNNNGYKWIPFGSGRRGCPGEGMGLRMVGLTLGTLIQCFDWKRIGDKGEMVDMTENIGVSLSKAKPLVASCRPRSAIVNLLSQL